MMQLPLFFATFPALPFTHLPPPPPAMPLTSTSFQSVGAHSSPSSHPRWFCCNKFIIVIIILKKHGWEPQSCAHGTSHAERHEKVHSRKRGAARPRVTAPSEAVNFVSLSLLHDRAVQVESRRALQADSVRNALSQARSRSA